MAPVTQKIKETMEGFKNPLRTQLLGEDRAPFHDPIAWDVYVELLSVCETGVLYKTAIRDRLKEEIENR